MLLYHISDFHRADMQGNAAAVMLEVSSRKETVQEKGK